MFWVDIDDFGVNKISFGWLWDGDLWISLLEFICHRKKNQDLMFINVVKSSPAAYFDCLWFSFRSWREVLIGLGTSSEETQTREIKGKSPLHNPDSWVKIVKKGSHTRDSKGKSALHDPDSWVKVVKKGSHMQKLDYPSKDTAKKQHIPSK